MTLKTNDAIGRPKVMALFSLYSSHSRNFIFVKKRCFSSSATSILYSFLFSSWCIIRESGVSGNSQLYNSRKTVSMLFQISGSPFTFFSILHPIRYSHLHHHQANVGMLCGGVGEHGEPDLGEGGVPVCAQNLLVHAVCPCEAVIGVVCHE